MKRKTNNEPGFTVLSLDPSLTAFGWVVCKGDIFIDGGCIKTEPASKKLRIRKGDDRMHRAGIINQVLLQVIKQHKVAFIVAELPGGSTNAVAAAAMAMVCGQVQAISDTLDIGLEWYTQHDAKMSVLGVGSCTKAEMINAIDKLFEVNWAGVGYIDEAVADALAVLYAAIKQSPVIKAMYNGFR